MMTYEYDNKACEEVKSETVKSILENMDAILTEMNTELRSIHDAIYGERADTKNETRQQDKCLLETLARQREEAANLLALIHHIREGLWRKVAKMVEFIVGLVIGMFSGAAIGIGIMAACAAGKRGDAE